MPRARKTSKLAVTRAGKKIARRGGIDAVTVRGVAAALDVTPMALYHHVGSASGLRLATLESILADVRPPFGDGPAAEQLRTFALQARSVLRRYPGAADAVLTSWPDLVQGCRLMEWLLATAATVTKRADRRVDIANGVFVYVLMRVVVERAALAGGRERKLSMVDAHPERFPHLVELQRRFARLDTERHFSVGLNALLDGLMSESRR